MHQERKGRDPYRKNKASSFPTRVFTTMKLGRYGHSFHWEILNFPRAKDRCIFSRYFSLWSFRFRFILFPKGQADLGDKHLTFQIVAAEGQFTNCNISCCVTSTITLINHADASKNLHIPVIYRFMYPTSNICSIKIVDLNTLHDPESGFLLKGTALHIHGKIFFLDEYKHICRVPTVSIPRDFPTLEALFEARRKFGREFYKIEISWSLMNYCYFQDNIGRCSIKSPAIQIGNCHYSIVIGPPNETNENDQLCMLMFLEPLDNIDGDFIASDNLNVWIISNATLWGPNLRISKDLFERPMTFIEVMKTSEFTSSCTYNPSEPEANCLSIRCIFYTFGDRESVDRKTANSNTVWNFGQGDSKSNMVADKVFFHYSWKIYNFFWIEKLIRETPADVRIEEIKGRRIRVEGTDFNMVIYPLGDAYHRDHLGVYLTAHPVATEDELDLLVHFRLSALNQRDPGRSIKRERIFRFCVAQKLHGFPEFIPIWRFYEDSVGFMDGGMTSFEAHIHILEETYDDKDLNMPAVCGSEILRVRWRVDNFLAWQGIVGATAIPSKVIHVNGCVLRIVFYVASNGILYGSLSTPTSLMDSSPEIYYLSYQIGVMKQKKQSQINSSEFKANVKSYTDRRTYSKIGILSDIMKQVDYIVGDKVVFFCNFYECTSMKHDDHAFQVVDEAPEMTSYADMEIVNAHN